MSSTGQYGTFGGEEGRGEEIPAVTTAQNQRQQHHHDQPSHPQQPRLGEDEEAEDDGTDGTVVVSRREWMEQHKLQIVTNCLIYVGTIAVSLCVSVIGPSLLDLQLRMHTSIDHVTWLLSAKASGALVGVITAGRTIDTRWRWLQLTLALAVMSGCCMSAPWPQEVLYALPIFILFGFTRAYFWCGSILTTFILWDVRKNSLSWLSGQQLGGSIGSMIGPLIVRPFLTEQNNTDNKHWGFLLGGEYDSYYGYGEMWFADVFTNHDSLDADRHIGLHARNIDGKDSENITVGLQMTDKELFQDRKELLGFGHISSEGLLSTRKGGLQWSGNSSDVTKEGYNLTGFYNDTETESLWQKAASLGFTANHDSWMQDSGDLVQDFVGFRNGSAEETEVMYGYLIAGSIGLVASLILLIGYFTMGGIHLESSENNRNNRLGQQNQRSCLEYVIMVVLVGCNVIFGSITRNYVSFMVAYVVHHLHWTKSEGAYLASTMSISGAVSKILCIYLVRIIKLEVQLFGGVLLCFAASLLLLFLADRFYIIPWVTTILYVVGLTNSSSVIFGWVDKVLVMRGVVGLLWNIGGCLGEIIAPFILGFLFRHVSYVAFVYYFVACQSIVVVCCVLLHLLGVCVSRERARNDPERDFLINA